jgi:uncharacterized membrane protein
MTEFAVAGVVFLAAHSLPSIAPLRRALAQALGRRGYLAAYSLMSLALLAWLISAALKAPYVGLWQPPPWAYEAALVLASLGTVLVAAGLVRANPLSVGFVGGAGFDPQRPGLVGVTRHPVLWGFVLWALAHVAANGDAVTVVLFAALGLFSLAGLWLVDRRHRRLLGQGAWWRLAARAPLIPFACGMPRFAGTDLLALGVGAAVTAALLAGVHLWLFGADPLIGLALR